MDNNKYYLSYNQIMMLMINIGKKRKENQYFKDAIAEDFELYCVSRVSEIAQLPGIVQKISPYNKYVVSKSTIDYLSRLLGIDIFDKKMIKEYKPIIADFENRAYEKYIDALEEINKKL